MESRHLTLVILVVAILAIGAYVYVNVGIPGTSKNTITMMGNSEVKSFPELVGVYLEITTQDEDASDAKDKNAEIYDKLRFELIKLGFDNSDIQSESYNIYPDYDWDGRTQKENGYKVSHRIKIVVDDFMDVGDVIDASVDNGALVTYINFELSEEQQSELKKQALKEAAQDAKEKAEALAEGSGKKLGKLVSLQSSDFYYQPWRYYDVAESGAAGLKQAATNINPSERQVTASVSAVYKIY